MADGQAPDQTQALLQMQSLIASSRGGSGALPILGILPGGGRDVNVGQSLSIQNGGLKFDATFAPVAQSKPGIIAGLKKQLGLNGAQIFDDIKKCAQGVQAMYSGDLPNGSLPGSSNAPRGSGSGIDLG